MNTLQKTVCGAVIAAVLCCGAAAAETESQTATAAFAQGCAAYRAGEWTSAVTLLRKAALYPANKTADTYYLLISAEMYSCDYTGALEDCSSFTSQFPKNRYSSYVQYQNGRAFFYIGEYDKSILTLSDFCHQYPDHEMYASALFWIAESFYAGYQMEDAKNLYSRIVNEFPSDPKAPAAQYRIDLINQQVREQKLLYLLKQTGEEYLAAKEEYEKQLKADTSEGVAALRTKALDLQKRNTELEAQAQELKQQIANLQKDNVKLTDTALNPTADDIQKLKLKALEAQKLLDAQEQEQKKEKAK